MNRPDVPSFSKGRIVAGCAIAFAMALTCPLLSGFCTVLIPFTFGTALLYAFSGMIPAVAAMLMNTLAFGLYFGMPGAAIAVTGFVLPSAFIVRGLHYRMPFAKLAVQSIGAQVLGVLAALGAAYAFVGSDIIGALVGEMRKVVELLPAGTIDFFLDKLYAIDSVPDMMTEEQMLNGVLDAARRANYLDGYMNDLSAALKLTMPGLLLSSAALTGVFSAALPAKIINRRSPANGAYVVMSRWFTPWGVSVGLLAMWVIMWLVGVMGTTGTESAQLTMQALLFLALRIQAAISLERRLIQFNMRPGIRFLVIAAVEVVFTEIAIYYGAFSALFGMTGAATQIRVMRGKDKDE